MARTCVNTGLTHLFFIICEIGTIFILILQMRKLRLRKPLSEITPLRNGRAVKQSYFYLTSNRGIWNDIIFCASVSFLCISVQTFEFNMFNALTSTILQMLNLSTSKKKLMQGSEASWFLQKLLSTGTTGSSLPCHWDKGKWPFVFTSD